MSHKLLLPLSILIAGLIAGCGGDDSTASNSVAGGMSGNPNSKQRLNIGIVFDAGGLGDKSFNDSAYAGITRAMQDLNISEKHVSSASEKDYETNLVSMVNDNKCDLVFAVGITMQSALEKAAITCPNARFAIIDTEVKAPNVRSILFREEEGSFLAGYVAGLATKTNKIGFVGGMELDLIKKFYYGYAAGAKTANPKVEVLAPKYTGSWDNADTAKAAALTLYGEGADIVYHAAGRAGTGVFAAAKAENEKSKGVFAIGVDQDQEAQAPGSVLTSMVKRTDEAVYQTIKDLRDGKFTTDKKIYDLKQNGVGVTLKFATTKIGQSGVEMLKKVEEMIKKGDLKVPSTEKEYSEFKAPSIKQK